MVGEHPVYRFSESPDSMQGPGGVDDRDVAAVDELVDAECLDAELDRAAADPGPTVIVAKVAESGTAPKPPLDCVFLKQRFMAALGNPEVATQGGDA